MMLFINIFDYILHENVTFQQLFVVVKMTERRKKNGLHSVIYVLYNSK